MADDLIDVLRWLQYTETEIRIGLHDYTIDYSHERDYVIGVVLPYVYAARERIDLHLAGLNPQIHDIPGFSQRGSDGYVRIRHHTSPLHIQPVKTTGLLITTRPVKRIVLPTYQERVQAALSEVKAYYRHRISEIIRMCLYCEVREANVLFLPCGHLVCCSSCFSSARKCKKCTKPIRGTKEIYYG